VAVVNKLLATPGQEQHRAAGFGAVKNGATSYKGG
jgi:hypothetical protein